MIDKNIIKMIKIEFENFLSFEKKYILPEEVNVYKQIGKITWYLDGKNSQK